MCNKFSPVLIIEENNSWSIFDINLNFKNINHCCIDSGFLRCDEVKKQKKYEENKI